MAFTVVGDFLWQLDESDVVGDLICLVGRMLNERFRVENHPVFFDGEQVVSSDVNVGASSAVGQVKNTQTFDSISNDQFCKTSFSIITKNFTREL